ncbi:MAG: two-component system NarL family sensor kinase [Parvicellaceae bacterium]|jgi:two-component system NarL family sensor kinase
MNYLQKYITIIFLLFVGCSGLFAQENEFVQELKRMKTLSYSDAEKFEELGEHLLAISKADNNIDHLSRILRLYGDRYYRTGEISKSDSVFQYIMSLDQSKVSDRIKNRTSIGLLMTKSVNGNRKINIQSLQELNKKFENQKDTLTWIEGCNSIGSLYSELNIRDSSLLFYLKALELAKSCNAHFHQAYVLNNIGLINLTDKQYEIAKNNFAKARVQSQLSDSKFLERYIVNNLGLVYMNTDSLDLAKSSFQEFLRLSAGSGSAALTGIARLNLGTIYYEQRVLDSSMINYNIAINSFQQLELKPHMARAFNGKSRLLLKMGEFESAKAMADSSLGLSVGTVLLADEIMSNKLISQVFDTLGMPKKALEFYKIYKELSDSLNGLSNDKTIADMQTKYSVKETEAALEMEEAKVTVMESEKQLSQFRWVLAISLGMALLIGIAIWFYIRVQKNNRRQQESFSQDLIIRVEKERGRIAQDLHDGVGQDLSVLKNKLGRLKKNDTIEVLEFEVGITAVIEQTRQISRSLFPSYLRKVGLAEVMSSLLDKTEQGTGIICSYDLPPLKKQPEEQVKIHVYRILQECISNTIKHANASALKVELLSEGDLWMLTYQDNGIGMPDKKKLKGMGMMSIAERVKMMDGQMAVSPNELGKGFKLKVTFSPQYND